MKRLLIATLCGVAALTIGNNARSSELTEEKEMEVEETTAEADGSLQDAAFLNMKVEQERLDAQLNLAAADKAVKAANAAKAKAETIIGRVESEIHVLQVQQKQAQMKQKAVQTQKTLAQRRLAVMIQQMRAYRAQLKKTQQRTQLEQHSLSAAKAKMAKLQKMRGPTRQMKSKKPVQTASNRSHLLATR